MDNHFSQDHCLPRELPCLPWGGDGSPSWEGGGKGEVCSQPEWEERRGRLLSSHPPPTAPPRVGSMSFPISPASSVAHPSPGRESFQKMNPGDISGPHSLWPSCCGSPACGGAPCFCMKDVCLPVSCSYSNKDCFWPWCCRLLEARLWTSQSLALLEARFLHW